MTDPAQRRDALGILPFLNDGRLWRIFLFGALSGFPWLLIGSAMTLRLKDEGLSRTSIGVFGLLFSVWTFNFLWAPIIDHARLPFLHRLGQLSVADPDAGRAAGEVAGRVVDSEAHQGGQVETVVHLGDDLLRRRVACFDREVATADLG